MTWLSGARRWWWRDEAWAPIAAGLLGRSGNRCRTRPGCRIRRSTGCRFLLRRLPFRPSLVGARAATGVVRIVGSARDRAAVLSPADRMVVRASVLAVWRQRD